VDLIGQLRKLNARVNGMVARAVIGRVNDALKTQRLQVTILDGDVEDDVEHMQPYGLSFVPPEGAELLALAVGGARSHTVGICANAPGTRPKSGLPGTGGLYHNLGWKVFIDPLGVVHIGAGTGTNFIALANLVLTRLNAIENTYNTHVHAVSTTGTAAAQTGTAAAPTAQMSLTTTVAATNAKAK